MAFAVPASTNVTRLQRVTCMKAPLFRKPCHGKSVRRHMQTPVATTALVNDRDNVSPPTIWSRAVDFMAAQAPKFVAALLLAAVLVRIRHSACSMPHRELAGYSNAKLR
jgi:hypothetical protein